MIDELIAAILNVIAVDVAALEDDRRLRDHVAGRPHVPTGAQWEALRACEASGDYSIVDDSGLYRGAYQFDAETWSSVGGTGDPAAAPPAEQDRRALKLWRARGWQPWPVCGTAAREAGK